MLLGERDYMQQTSKICDELIPNGNYALVLGDIEGQETRPPSEWLAPAFIASSYGLPLISLAEQSERAPIERDLYRNAVRLLPHKAHEVSVVIFSFRLVAWNSSLVTFFRSLKKLAAH